MLLPTIIIFNKLHCRSTKSDMVAYINAEQMSIHQIMNLHRHLYYAGDAFAKIATVDGNTDYIIILTHKITQTRPMPPPDPHQSR